MVRASRLVTLAPVVLIAGAAFFVRTYFPYANVFPPGYVNFQTPDSWYHMRLVEHTVRNFPYRTWYDPYLGFGDGRVDLAPLLDVLVAGAALLVGLGAPSTRQIDVVGAFAPAVLGALTIVPAYVIGRRLYGTAAGLFGAAMLTLAPGHFLARSILGYTDHHVLEILLAAVTVALLLVALQTFDESDDGARRASLPWSVLAGVALGAYLLAWASGAFLVFILWGWLVFQIVLDGLRRRSSAPVLWVTTPMLAVALALVLALQAWPYGRTFMKVIVLGGALGTALIMAVLEVAVARRRALRLLIPVAIAAIVVAGVAIFARLAPDLYGALVAETMRLRPRDMAAMTVEEALPLFAFPFESIWGLFGSSIALGLVALPLLAVRVLSRHAPGHALMLVWTLVVLAVTLRQNRFGYYLSFNLAVLSGHVCALALEWSGGGGSRPAWARAATGVLLAALVVVAPNAGLVAGVASHDAGIPAARYEALGWLRRETPEPFADPDYYFAPYDASGRQAAVPVPFPGYTIMTWWDYGYDVVRVARRAPTSNPTQGGAWWAGRFFLGTEEAAGARVMRDAISRYVLVTEAQLFLPYAPGLVSSSFHTMARWGNKSMIDFVEEAVERGPDGSRRRALIFLPAYYRTMASRLYLFDGRAVTPENSTWVVTYEDAPWGGREIVESRQFATYEDGQRYVKRAPPGRRAIVGRDALRSPVPLPALQDFVLVHQSADARTRFHRLPTVKIFEFKHPVPPPRP